MDIQYFGGNCVSFANKDLRVIVDDNLVELGLKSNAREGDIVLYTGPHQDLAIQPRLLIDQPGEYEVSGLSILGLPAQGHMDSPGSRHCTIYKLLIDDVSYLLTG